MIWEGDNVLICIGAPCKSLKDVQSGIDGGIDALFDIRTRSHKKTSLIIFIRVFFSDYGDASLKH